MSGESKEDQNAVKRKFEEKSERISIIDATCRSSVAVRFRNKCKKFFEQQLDDKSKRDYNNSRGKTF